MLSCGNVTNMLYKKRPEGDNLRDAACMDYVISIVKLR
jgi:hypothetical protein